MQTFLLPSYLHYGDADAAHGVEAASVLQLLRRVSIHLYLLLLDGRSDPQEVRGKLSDVHLSTGPETSLATTVQHHVNTLEQKT